MAFAAPIFNVSFGVNQTFLTKALEEGQYEHAKKLIIENQTASYLDEGFYQRTPLFIVLSGFNQFNGRAIPRNLELARLLIVQGANPSHRVPNTLGSEFLGPGEAPLQLAVDYFNELSEVPYPRAKVLSATDVIGLNGEVGMTTEECLEQLVTLTWLLLGRGADPNVRDSQNKTPLHKTMVSSVDLRMAQCLLDNGADVNAVDGFGDTALISACTAFPFGLDDDMCDDNPLAGVAWMQQGVTRKSHMTFLLDQPGLQVDIQNRQDHTALFECMAQGDTTTAQQLLEHGASPSLEGRVNDPSTGMPVYVTPLLASLMSPRLVNCDRRDRSYQFLAHLVDKGYFSTPEITNELIQWLGEESMPSSDLTRLQSLGSRLVHAIFGSTTNKLSQLCARQIFQAAFLRQLSSDAPQDDYQGTFFSDDKTSQDFCACLMMISTDQLLRLISDLHLPRDSLQCFEVELFKHRLCARFLMYEWWEGRRCVSDDEEEGDSDLEYW
ncbi:uncharacterized protein LOC144885926 [Branchiostoma floridae x Branchiostoma japonicum]